ncbi:MAG: hypothetical protein R2875_02370 [Desulfobacterales bacterium]
MESFQGAFEKRRIRNGAIGKSDPVIRPHKNNFFYRLIFKGPPGMGRHRAGIHISGMGKDQSG